MSSHTPLGKTEQTLSLVATWMLDSDVLRAPQACQRARVAIARKIDATVRFSQDNGNFHMALLDWIALRDEQTVIEVAIDMGYVVRRASPAEIEDHYDAECKRKRRNDLGYRYQRMSKVKRNPPFVVEYNIN